jgi:hypothetical protein
MLPLSMIQIALMTPQVAYSLIPFDPVGSHIVCCLAAVDDRRDGEQDDGNHPHNDHDDQGRIGLFSRVYSPTCLVWQMMDGSTIKVMATTPMTATTTKVALDYSVWVIHLLAWFGR